MNQPNPFVRKIIYIASIGALLIPISMVSRPETRNAEGDIKDAGGQLSILRDKNELSQANLSEIDPASETMKLASLGLRGVAVNILWMQAMEHKKTENYEQLNATLNALTKIQPNFVKVWEYQAHNLAYNVSMEFDDYEYRYQWVKKGIVFLTKGIPYNKRDHRIPDNLGFFTGNKIGKSDEKSSFRRMFGKDEEFHNDLSKYVAVDDYKQRGYGPDNWKMAWLWYDRSRTMVEDQSCDQLTGDILFYMYRPAQVRNQAMSLQEENRANELTQDIWVDADIQWQEYGQQKIANTLGVTINLEGLARLESELLAKREQLDGLIVPSPAEPERTGKKLRQDMMAELMDEARLTDEQIAVMEIPNEERNDEQVLIARTVYEIIGSSIDGIDLAIANEVAPEDRLEANKLLEEMQVILEQIRTIDRDSTTVNYRYWRECNEAESKQMTIDARKAMFDAHEKWRQSLYDDEYDFDFQTKTRTITERGAISLYLDAFRKWDEVFKAYPLLKDGKLAKELVYSMHEYWDMLLTTEREWPDDFPMQSFIDDRFDAGESDQLPTSGELEERRFNREGSAQPAIDDPKPASDDVAPEKVPDDGSADDKGSADDEASADDDASETDDASEADKASANADAPAKIDGLN